MKLSRFLAELGSRKGAPGGGAAAALVAATGAALVEMTARLNDKRLKHCSGNAAKAAELRVRLFGLIAKDTAAFQKIQKNYSERKKKPALWQDALKTGVQPPLSICENSAEAARLAKKEAPRTSAWLESDRREALILLRAAFDSAKLNVDINLKSIQNRTFVRAAQRKTKKWRSSL